MKVYRISGNTYPYRDMLTRLGMTWDKEKKAWETDNQANAEKAINPTYAGRRAPKDLRLDVAEVEP